jgi:hypothetical protein
MSERRSTTLSSPAVFFRIDGSVMIEQRNWIGSHWFGFG